MLSFRCLSLLCYLSIIAVDASPADTTATTIPLSKSLEITKSDGSADTTALAQTLDYVIMLAPLPSLVYAGCELIV